MNWKDLKKHIYYQDGSLRDIYIFNTSRLDWQEWVKYVNMNYRIQWFNSKYNKYESYIDFRIIEEFWQGNIDTCPTANVFINNIQINVHFFEETKIENDIDPSQINSLEDSSDVIKYMSDISTLLNKEVLLTPENYQELSLLRVHGNNIEFTKEK